MSGGSQHNPNGRQAQLAPGWSPLQLQMASYLSRAPAAHLPERGVTWHTPTPPPHLYHVPQPSPPDPLQPMKMANAAANVFRHTATPPDLFRHTPTPPDKHIRRHTPSPGDPKASGNMNPVDIYSQIGGVREKLRPEDMLGYARGGVDLSVNKSGTQNGPPLALSVRDAPTINNLIARSQRPQLSRVDSLLERLTPAPHSPHSPHPPHPAPPHSVIVHSRATPATPSPDAQSPDNDDSGDSNHSKRKRKQERTIRLATPQTHNVVSSCVVTTTTSAGGEENGDAQRPLPHARRKRNSASSESLYDIAAVIADAPADIRIKQEEEEIVEEPLVTDNIQDKPPTPDVYKTEGDDSTKLSEEASEERTATPDPPPVEIAAAPRRESLGSSACESTNVPVESPSEAKQAETETPSEKTEDEPDAASFVEVENELEKMFAGIGEGLPKQNGDAPPGKRTKGRKRRKSIAPKGARKSNAATGDEETPKKRGRRKKVVGEQKKAPPVKEAVNRDAYDSGSNASSGKSRGPYIQIRGPRDSPSSVSVVNTADDDGERQPKGSDYRSGARARGLLCSTLGTRYDATTADVTWLCVFCERGPHAGAREREPGPPLGDLFGPYSVTTHCEEFMALDDAERRRWTEAAGSVGGEVEVWTHEECALWAPGVVLAGARAWGLAAGVWRARGAKCGRCGRGGAGIACKVRGCASRAHAACARLCGWRITEESFAAECSAHT